MGSEPAIARADAGVALGTFGGAVVMIWRGTRPTHESLGAGTALVRAYALARNGPVGVISIVEHGTPIPGRAERDVLSREMREVSHDIVAAVFVAEGVGPWTQLALATVSALDGLRQRVVKQKYCIGVEEAVAWLAPRLPPPVPSRAELLAAIRIVRSHPER